MMEASLNRCKRMEDQADLLKQLAAKLELVLLIQKNDGPLLNKTIHFLMYLFFPWRISVLTASNNVLSEKCTVLF